MSDMKHSTDRNRARKRYQKPAVRKLGSFDEFTRTAGDTILQFDTPYPNIDLTTS
jgi:hypothetical protein